MENLIKKEFGQIAEQRKEKFNPISSSENRKCVELEHIEQETGKLLGNTFSNQQKSIKNVFYKGDVLFGKLRPYLKKYWFADFDGVCSSEIWVLKPKGNNITKEYLFNLVQSNEFIQATNVSSGSKMPRADWDYIFNFPFSILHSLKEQKAIADCLSTWDVAIDKQSQLIEKLTERKKSLMQQLLTGKKRLPGFVEKWSLKSINDLFIFKNGKAHENDIHENGKYILINSKFISTDGEISKKTNRNLAPLEVNDLVFVMSDVPKGKALAKFFLIKEDNLFTLNQRIGLLKIKKGNPIFMYYLLNRNSYFLMFDNGVGQTNLRKDDILECPLNIPSLSEQTAIAEILATADRELQLQKEKLAQLQTQKKGLMQVLLTGKKRLIN